MVQQREIYQWGWGSFEVRLGRRAHPGPGTQVDSIVADGQLEVCDGAYGIFVMKEKFKGPALRFSIGRATRGCAGHFHHSRCAIGSRSE